MNRVIFFVAVFLCPPGLSILYCQTNCGIDILLNQSGEIYIPPSLKKSDNTLKIVSSDLQKNEYSPIAGIDTTYYQTFPSIPGFASTGNAEVDKIEFSIAKQRLYAQDRDTYLKLTRNPNPKFSERNPK